MRIRATGAIIVAVLSAVAAIGAQPPGPIDPLQPQDTTGIDSLVQEPPEMPADSALVDSLADSLVVESPAAQSPAVDPDDPSSVLLAYFEALRIGDSAVILEYTSSDALEGVTMMLEGLQESLDRDEAGTLARMTSSGYAVTAGDIEDWEPSDYLAAAVALPMMRNRYTAYDLQVGAVEVDGDEAEVALTFVTASGAGIPFPALLIREDDVWKVSAFLGLNSFP